MTKSKQFLLEYVQRWLDENEGDHETDDDCFCALAQSVNSSSLVEKPSAVDLRKIYEAEKGER